jgi:hypothetical protein
LDFLSVILPEIMVCAMAMMPEQENMNARRRAYGMRI